MARRKMNQETSGQPETSGEGSGNKTDAVKMAIAALGDSAKATEIQDYLSKNHGVNITTGHIYTIKSSLSRKATGKTGAGSKGKRRGRKAKAAKPAQAAAPASNGRSKSA